MRPPRMSKYGHQVNYSEDREVQLAKRAISRAPVSLASVAGTGGMQELKVKKKYKRKMKRYV